MNGTIDDCELSETYAQHGLLGRSPLFVKTLKLIERFGCCDAPVLLEGHTGTGKELVARAIHYRGNRQGQPFVPINCGAIPDNLVENELFGHERGAFTDAKVSRAGLVSQANGGTLFLDEVDALSTKAQVALLRFLEDHEFRPVGGLRLQRVDTRILAATNSSLQQRVEGGRFRQDLFFRLNILLLELPPLEARSGDVEFLAQHFLHRQCRRHRMPPKSIAPEALDWMLTHSWPGNVRELENLMYRAFVLADGTTIHLDHLLQTADQPTARSVESRFQGSFREAKLQVIERFEKTYLTWLMDEAKGNVTRAARRAGKERRALGKLLKKHGIQRRNFLPETTSS